MDTRFPKRAVHRSQSRQVSQDEAVHELEEILLGRSTKENLHFTLSMHTMCRSFVGQMNSLCYNVAHIFQMPFDGSFSNSWRYEVSPQTGETIKSQPVKLRFWQFTGPLRILCFFDASYRNKDDCSLKKGMTVFSAEARERFSREGMIYGILIQFESQKIKKIVLSTVAELYSFMKRIGPCQSFQRLWLDVFH